MENILTIVFLLTIIISTGGCFAILGMDEFLFGYEWAEAILYFSIFTACLINIPLFIYLLIKVYKIKSDPNWCDGNCEECEKYND